MGYVELATVVPGTKRATISLWFRVPQASIDAATATNTSTNGGGEPAILQGVIPLVVFGPTQKRKGIKGTEAIIGTVPSFLSHYCAGNNDGTWSYADVPSIPGRPNPGPTLPIGGIRTEFDPDKDKDVAPSYIGIDCNGAYPMLAVNIVMPSSNKATSEFITEREDSIDYAGQFEFWGDGLCVNQFEYEFTGGGTGFCHDAQGGYSVTSTMVSNDAFFIQAAPENFQLLPRPGTIGGTEYKGIKVTGDHFHHLLLSFDLSQGCITHGTEGSSESFGQLPGFIGSTFGSAVPDPNTEGDRTDSACRMFVALDDVNYTGKDMAFYHPKGYSDENAILTPNAYLCAGVVNFNSTTEGNDCSGNIVDVIVTSGQPTYSFTPTDVPFATIGLPSIGKYVNKIHHVELGEFQMFLDISIDTSSVGARRAFITKDGTAAPVRTAANFIGKSADVLLHGAGNWKKARDTGTIAKAVIPPASGTPVGDIETYKPNPSLNGDQGR